jgi:hypothetical protein
VVVHRQPEEDDEQNKRQPRADRAVVSRLVQIPVVTELESPLVRGSADQISGDGTPRGLPSQLFG